MTKRTGTDVTRTRTKKEKKMSFSKQVKEELSKLNNLANRQEVNCEFWGYLESNNITDTKYKIKYSTENDYNIDRFAKLARNVGIENFNIDVNGNLFFIEIGKVKLKNVKEIKIEDLNLQELKAFIRGSFMGAGSINNPQNKYNLEFKVKSKDLAIKIVDILEKFDILLKQKDNLLYIKDGEEISKFLAFIGANKSVLKFEEIRVQKHMNNKINRLVNCESANLNKVLNASIEQINAIKKLQQNGKFENLDESLKEVANLRLQFPDMPIEKLGEKMINPIGKSGVNYRLQKIIKIAET